jgi:vacuolar-type H+-ATPase subunit E/Vma4
MADVDEITAHTSQAEQWERLTAENARLTAEVAEWREARDCAQATAIALEAEHIRLTAEVERLRTILQRCMTILDEVRPDEEVRQLCCDLRAALRKGE